VWHDVRAILIDLDGVLYVGERPLDGARGAIAQLGDAGAALRFVTNTTARSRASTLDKLTRLGFHVAVSELVTPAALAVQHCRDRGHRRVALVMNEDVKADFSALEEADRDVDAVIMGDLGTAFGYEVLNSAFRHVLGGAELIALQKNRYWLREDGLCLDAGPFVAAIEYATGTSASVVGKPEPGFFGGVLADLGVAAPQAAMIGDDVESDVGGALRAGLQGILVQTGKYRPDTVDASGITPSATVASIVEAAHLITGRTP